MNQKMNFHICVTGYTHRLKLFKAHLVKLLLLYFSSCSRNPFNKTEGINTNLLLCPSLHLSKVCKNSNRNTSSQKQDFMSVKCLELKLSIQKL